MSRVRVGVIGCGMISEEYLQGMRAFELLEVVACADLDAERARARAAQFGVPSVLTPQQLLESPEVEIVVNLTPPLAHAAVNGAAIAAGKHVFCEKPLGVTLQEGAETIAAARAQGVRVGCAPDTFLGGAQQTLRKLIDDGAIGRPVAAVGSFLIPGTEHLIPHPQQYYLRGAGPMLDMGPYYVTALIALLGPARRVSGSAIIAQPQRTVVLGPRAGEELAVEVKTHVTGTIDFACGAVATLMMSWEAWGSTLPHLEIYGTGGSLTGPDPDYHDGGVRLLRGGGNWEQVAWEQVALTHDPDVRRGIGVADMAYALRSGRPHRAGGELALHALEIMCAFEASSATGAHVELVSTCDQPAALPPGLPHGTLD